MRTLSTTLLVAAGVLLAPAAAFAQPIPTEANVRYGKHERQVLDFYRAKADAPTPVAFFIHGGGWGAGSKDNVSKLLDTQRLLDNGVSVVAINYRYVHQAKAAGVDPPVKWPLEDAAWALQFVRSKAKDWNLDKERVGACGGSAGAGSSLWLALHDDMADPESADTVARESTRLWCAAVVGAQTSLDPKQVREWMPSAVYGGHAFGFRTDGKDKAAEYQKFLDGREVVLKHVREYSPIEHASKDDPPLWLSYSDTAEVKKGDRPADPTHSALYGLMLREKLAPLGVEMTLTYPGKPDGDFKSATDYLLASLKAPRPRPASPPGPASRPPNVLFVIADDMNKRLPCFGDRQVRAPNVERLAARAVRFDRAYCQYPVCSPSRVSFLSGRRPERTGMYGNEGPSRTPPLRDVVFLPEHFRKNGYRTVRLGKVFHIGREVPECWDLSEEGTPDGKLIYQPAEPDRLDLRKLIVAEHGFSPAAKAKPFGGGEGAQSYALSGGADRLIDVRNAARAAELLKDGAARNARGEPFFLALGFRRPHLPHLAPREYFDRYPAEAMPLPPRGGPAIPGINKPVPDEDHREALRGYLACVSFMDEQLGKVFDALDQHKLWDSTVVVFISDHGYLLGSRGGWWGKNVLYDESASTAMLVAAPGKAKGVGSQRVVEFLDLYPTLADLCGLPAPAGAEGRSIAPLLAKPDSPWDHPAYTVIATGGKPTGLGVTAGRWRYLQHPDGRKELFDVESDPREWKDLAADPGYAAELARMEKLADDYKRKYRGGK
ncbi:MAG: hypothetical protein C0501_28875 [Isosphaera sp.]|nr:hypothetical protein [Isosphaera sp.]